MPAIEPVHQLIPDDIVIGTDQYDAAICAIMAAVYAGSSSQLQLPNIVPFQQGFNRSEGWIYGLPADYVTKYQFD